MEILSFMILKFIMINYCKTLMISSIMFLMSLNLLFKLNYMKWWSIYFNFSLNYYSLSLIILTYWILSIIIMNLNSKFNKNNILLIYLMLITMNMNFMSMNLMLFYYFYELILLLIFILIMKWSSSKFKSMASYMLMFYTLFFSLPMLMILNFIKIKYSTTSFIMLENIHNMKLNFFMLMFLMMSFLVKIPMFLFHSWLLKAHVEAPYYGSMILASIMLKLGSYGLLRMFFIFYKMMKNNSLLMSINMMSILIMSIMCLRQIDMKLLIAISSIVHMGLMINSMFTNLMIGYMGSYMMMLAHGLSSSSLFYLVNTIYLESKSRLMMLNKGLIMFMPSMSMMWFMICSTNMAAPISINLISEIFLLISLIMWLKLLIIFLMMYCMFSFIYSIYLFSYVNHGNMESLNYFFSNKNLMTFLSLLLHWIPLNLITLNMYIMM